MNNVPKAPSSSSSLFINEVNAVVEHVPLKKNGRIEKSRPKGAIHDNPRRLKWLSGDEYTKESRLKGIFITKVSFQMSLLNSLVNNSWES